MSLSRTVVSIAWISVGLLPALGQQLTQLYDFNGGSDGANPYAGLIFDNDGALYGTTSGISGYGTIFKLTPPSKGETAWTKIVLHSFSGGDGADPRPDLIFDHSGALYGTTRVGGIGSCDDGCGVVFKLAPPGRGETNWTETVLYRFTGGSDGSNPWAGVIIDKDGALYGTTQGGGINERGTVFKLTPPSKGQTVWTEIVLHPFTDSDGYAPLSGRVVADHKGTLYGTTIYGGYNGRGVVFSLTPPIRGQTAWTESVLYNFTGVSDGGYPSGALLLDKDGILYGTTRGGGTGNCDQGCGVVFMLAPPGKNQSVWTQTVIYNFSGASDGNQPWAGLIADKNGALYGTTYGGGIAGCSPLSGIGCGVVFKLKPPARGQTAWTETVLYDFSGADGADPVAGLIEGKGGALYGTTLFGGNNNNGIIFRLTVP